MPVEVRIGSRKPGDTGRIVGAIKSDLPGSFGNFDPSSPSILSVICAPDDSRAEIYRFANPSSVRGSRTRLISSDMYTEDALEATLEPGEGTDSFECDIVTKAGHAARLALRLMAPGEIPG